MTEALYRKWRPQLWDKVVGQDHIVLTLQNAIRSNRIGHAYLFSGPRGTGKTTTARLLAKAVNCMNPDINTHPCNECENCLAVNQSRFLDLYEIDAASNTSVDDIRDLREKIGFSPSQGKYKVYIIDEVHMLSTAAFNALLKTLEEPPAHAIFILATTEVHKIPATVLSRCQRYEFRRIPVTIIVDLLRRLVKAENLQVDDETLFMIARHSTGAMRDAISLLDQLTSTGEKVTLEIAQQVMGTATNQTVINLVDLICAQDTKDCLDQLHAALDAGTDPRQFARQMVDYLRGLMLIQMGDEKAADVTNEVRLEMEERSQRVDLKKLTELLKLFNNAANESRLAWQPSLALELAIAQGIQLFSSEDKSPAQGFDRDQASSKKKFIEQPSESVPAVVGIEVKTDIKEVFEEPIVKTRKTSRNEEVKISESGEKKELTINEVRAALVEVRNLIRSYRKNTEALLASARSITVKNGMIVLGYQSTMLKERTEKGEHLEIIQRAFSHVLGTEAKVKVVEMTSKSDLDKLEDEFDPDSLVRAALDLGGKIVDKE